MGPIQVVVQDGNNLVLEVTPTADTNVILDRGVAGTAATIAVGTTTSLAPGNPATVTNVGTSAAAVFNFGIPTAGGIAAGGSTTQVQYNLSGVLAGSANMTFNGTTLNVLSLTEANSPVVVQTDIGTAPNEIPLNQYLGNLAYQDAANIAGDLRAGSINNTPIGVTTTSTGAFTSLSSSGNLDVTGQARLGNGVTPIAPSTTDIAATAHTILSGAGGNILTFGQYPAGQNFAQWIQSSFGNPTTATYNLVLQPLGGNVGIGTSSQTSKLQILQSSTTAYGFITNTPTVGLTAGNYVNMAYFANGRGASNDGLRIVNVRDSTGSGVGNWETESYRIRRSVDYNDGATGVQEEIVFGSSILAFNTGNGERVRIDASGNVGIGTASPSASAILDAQSTTKGVRMPNMTTTQKNAIASPAAGLMVFDTTLAKLCVYSGVAWQTITSI